MGYGATVTEALSQVGIDASAVTKVRGEEEAEEQPEDKDKGAAAESDDEAPQEERKVDVAARDDAARRISDALQKLNDAQKNGDYAAQGQALAELDRAATDYQKANGQ